MIRWLKQSRYNNFSNYKKQKTCNRRNKHKDFKAEYESFPVRIGTNKTRGKRTLDPRHIMVRQKPFLSDCTSNARNI